MNGIVEAIGKAFVNNEKTTIVPVGRLHSLRDEIDRFRSGEELNGFQKWIVDNMYEFSPPDVGFPVESIILIAVPHPLYAEVELTHRGRAYRVKSPVMSDFDSMENRLEGALAPEGYRMARAGNIPLKRLAVKSGLAEYGRNNICYVDGLGSNFSFAAYYSDCPCGEGSWKDVSVAPQCSDCNACLNSCPTGAIRGDRFLIDNERCLSFLNESGDPFPEWLPKGVHHSVYDCLKCQVVCPMNGEQLENVAGPVHFTESETAQLMAKAPFEEFPESFRKKAMYLGLQQWPDGIAKNIKVLIEMSDRKNNFACH